MPVDKNQIDKEEGVESLVKITGMYKEWFLDYASYVILERAIPAISDGLKPVQRRILHSMRDLDDGRYNKVANIVGHTMQYHPHGDASIADATEPTSDAPIYGAKFGSISLNIIENPEVPLNLAISTYNCSLITST